MANNYNGTINENVPWNSGDSSTNNLPPSGKAIRELIQSRIKQPVFITYDATKSKYRVFSCRENYNTWNDANQNYGDEMPKEIADLQLAELDAPNPYAIEVYEGDGVKKIPFATSKRYVSISNNDGSSKLSFAWELTKNKNTEGGNFVLKIRVIHKKDNSSESFTLTTGTTSTVIDMAPYLYEGDNEVTITITDTITKTSGSRTFSMECLNLTISSIFGFQNKLYKDTAGISGQIPITSVCSNVNATITILTLVDDRVNTNYIQTLTNVASNGDHFINFNFPIGVEDFPLGRHKLKIVAFITEGDSVFYSNMLLFTIYNQPTGLIVYDDVLIGASIPNVTEDMLTSDVQLVASQYQTYNLNWGFISTDSVEVPVTWKLITILDGTVKELCTTTAVSEQQYKLSFIPTTVGHHQLISEYDYEGNHKVETLYLNILPSPFDVSETAGYDLKFDAIGKNNTVNKGDWRYGRYTGTFNNFSWDSSCGWNNNTLVIAAGASFRIDYSPFEVANDTTLAEIGRTVEIEFKTSNISDANESVAIIGKKGAGSYIKITSNSAGVYEYNQDTDTENEFIYTRFKEGEKLKLAFVFNPDIDSLKQYRNIVMIINNGTFERVKSLRSFNVTPPNAGGEIYLGGTGASITVYSIRCYRKRIEIDDAFKNFALDSVDPSLVMQNNLVMEGKDINYDKVSAKIKTFLIKGNVPQMLNAFVDQAKYNMKCDLIFKDPEDPTRDFTVKNCRIRKHGQSNLNVPIPSFKIWFNSEFTDDFTKQFYGGTPEENPVNHRPTLYDANGVAVFKGRYAMKKGAIKANKFVLQSNYADSSGTHNGGILRMINDSWFNAQIDGEYKLRQGAQIYAHGLDVNGTSQWEERTRVKFPTTIKTAPDSCPCCVFYQLPPVGDQEQPIVFLGQYVWMDDKKSDFLYGERSIYNVKDDPFCLEEKNKDLDIPANRLWNNDKVTRYEVLEVNRSFTSYLDTISEEGEEFEDEITTDSSEFRTLAWERQFELIYPDKDDITTSKKFDFNKFKATTKPFVDWFKGLIATRRYFLANGGRLDNNLHCHVTRNDTNPNDDGAWDEFRLWAKGDGTTAHPAHLDLYKMAAYYIFLLRCGAVDNMERNAQIFTDDGVKFYYTPWDWDIAYGKKNTGSYAYDPPINRNTRSSVNVDDNDPLSQSGFAMSGRGTNTSNWLWDALEAWPEWIDVIVPKVASALYNAGFNYNALMAMHDDEYANKWCERIYNNSTAYKYVENGAGSYYDYQNGSAKTLRHWWCGLSMDYYDAKWKCGDFGSKTIYIRCQHTTLDTDVAVVIPAINSFYAYYYGESASMYGFIEGKKDTNVPLKIMQNLSEKVQCHFLNARYIKGLDISDLTDGLNEVQFNGATIKQEDGTYMTENLRMLNVGAKTSYIQNGGKLNTNPTIAFTFANTGSAVSYPELKVLIEDLNIQGVRTTDNCDNVLGLISKIVNLKKFRAACSTLTSFLGGAEPSHYEVLQLPDCIQTLRFSNSSWVENNWIDGNNNPDTNTGLSFWSMTGDDNGPKTIAKCQYIPLSLVNLTVECNNTNNNVIARFIKQWIQALLHYAEVDNSLDVDTLFSNRNLKISNIHITPATGVTFTYEELMYLAKFNGGKNDADAYKTYSGYVMLANSDNLGDEELQRIQAAFGVNVFNKNGGKFVVDYERKTTIVSLAGLTADTVEYSDEAGVDFVIKEGYTVEGDPYSYKLIATSFTLGTDNYEYKWQFEFNGIPLDNQLIEGQEIGSHQGATITKVSNSWYLSVPEMTPGADDYIRIRATNITSENRTYKTMVIKVIHKAYITDIELSTLPPTITTSIENESETGRINAYLMGRSLQLIPSFIYNNDELEKVSIAEVKWRIKNIEDYINVGGVQSGHSYNLSYSDNIDEPFVITPYITITYKNGYQFTRQYKVLIANDEIILNSSAQNNYPLYRAFVDEHYLMNNNAYTKYSLKDIKRLIINNDNSQKETVISFDSTIDGNEYKVMNYITEVTDINLSLLKNLGHYTFTFNRHPSLANLNLGRTSDDYNPRGTGANIVYTPSNANDLDSYALANVILGHPESIHIENDKKLTKLVINDATELKIYKYINNSNTVSDTENGFANKGAFALLASIISAQMAADEAQASSD